MVGSPELKTDCELYLALTLGGTQKGSEGQWRCVVAGDHIEDELAFADARYALDVLRNNVE